MSSHGQQALHPDTDALGLNGNARQLIKAPVGEVYGPDVVAIEEVLAS